MPECRTRLIAVTMTEIENMTAMTRPMATRGIGATFSRSINAIMRPLQTSLMIAKKVENTSPPLVVYGRRIKWDAVVAPSIMTMAMIWASPLPFAKAMNKAFKEDAIRRMMKK